MSAEVIAAFHATTFSDEETSDQENEVDTELKNILDGKSEKDFKNTKFHAQIVQNDSNIVEIENNKTEIFELEEILEEPETRDNPKKQISLEISQKPENRDNPEKPVSIENFEQTDELANQNQPILDITPINFSELIDQSETKDTKKIVSSGKLKTIFRI